MEQINDVSIPLERRKHGASGLQKQHKICVDGRGDNNTPTIANKQSKPQTETAS